MSQPQPNLEQTVRGLQVITAALVMGVLMFAGISVVVGGLSEEPDGVIISALAAAWTGLAFIIHLIVPSLISRQRSRGTSREQLYGVYQSKTIIGLALLEGAAFFNVIALMIEHNWWSLAIAGGLVFWMLSAFPTPTKVEHWIETQQMQQGIV